MIKFLKKIYRWFFPRKTLVWKGCKYTSRILNDDFVMNLQKRPKDKDK